MKRITANNRVVGIVLILSGLALGAERIASHLHARRPVQEHVLHQNNLPLYHGDGNTQR